jgi:ParB/RepB/Spo0J family partition protein
MAIAPTTQLVHLRHDQLIPAADNVRSHVGDVSELANSIAAIGVLQPLRVSMPDGAKKATIVAGERRHAAIGELITDGRWKKTQPIPCVFDGELADEDRVVAMLVENLQRADLDPIEEANGYQRLISDFGYSRERVRVATGRSKTAVQVRLALLKLAPEVQAAVAARTFPLDLASRLAALPKDVQEKIVQEKGPEQITPWTIEQAETDLARKELVDRFTKTCLDRGVMWTSQPGWQLTKTHTATMSIPAKDFATTLLPADLNGAFARLDTYQKQVEIWMPAGGTEDTAAGDEQAAWRYECDRIRSEHAKAITAWNERRLEQLALFARKAPAKLVHEAALFDVLDQVGDLVRTSERVGFELPKAELDDDQAVELAEEWLKQPANLLAAAAFSMLESPWSDTGLSKAFAEHVATEIGEKPTMPDLPVAPDLPVSTDVDTGASITDLADVDPDAIADVDPDAIADLEDLDPASTAGAVDTVAD